MKLKLTPNGTVDMTERYERRLAAAWCDMFDDALYDGFGTFTECATCIFSSANSLTREPECAASRNQCPAIKRIVGNILSIGD